MSNKTWSGLFKINSKRCLKVRARASTANAVLVVGALLFAYPAAMAQDAVDLEQQPAEPPSSGNGGNPFSNH